MGRVMVLIKVIPIVFFVVVLVASLSVRADGMVPETTVVILNEEDGETTINIKNTDATPALLYSSIENLPEDPEFLALVTPPITRVEASDKQLVRVIGQFSEPLKTQRLKRIIFEGVPPRKPTDTASVGVTIRQNLPLILHPKDLPQHNAPWELLTWHLQGTTLSVRNDSAYVVRLADEVVLSPQKQKVYLPRTYILPGEALSVPMNAASMGATSVSISPATVYGFTVEKYDAQIVAHKP